jgi:hypothetical protein
VKSDKCGLKCELTILEQHWSNLLEIKGGPVINYRALTFAFVGTLVFSIVVGLAQQLGFHSVSWLGLPALMISLWSFGLILYSSRDR